MRSHIENHTAFSMNFRHILDNRNKLKHSRYYIHLIVSQAREFLTFSQFILFIIPQLLRG